MYANTRPRLAAGTLTLPASHYTDPQIFREEMERIYFDMWVCAGRSEQLPSAGSYFVRRVANASVIVLRDEQGALRAFHNTCRHRGTLLCKDDEGKLASRIQCPYHGWTYGLDGRLRNAPHMEKVEGFREANHPLGGVAVDEWDGHVFINLAEDPAPLREQLGALVGKFRPWRMEELVRVERRVYALKANWKLIVQNYSECLHCPIAHPQLQQQSHYMSGDNEPPHDNWLGGRMELREGSSTLSSLESASRSPPLPGLDDEQARHVYYYAVLPNLLLNLHPDYMVTTTIWPVAVDRSEVVCEWHFHPDEVRRPGFDPRGAVEFWDLTNRQDWELSDLAQEGIASRGYRPGPYSNREDLLPALDDFVLRRTDRFAPA
jgi:Rieske 2Fe-2S family protein